MKANVRTLHRPMRFRGALILAMVLASYRVQAGGPVEGQPFATNDYAIDLFQGPVLAPLRITGLSGAFAGYSEGIDAVTSNAAAVAVREPYAYSWLDFDFSLGFALPATFQNTDFDNDGKVGFTYNNFLFYNAGVDVQIGPFGIGALADFQRYVLTPSSSSSPGGKSEFVATLSRVHAVAGWRALDGGLTVGVGARIVRLSVAGSSANVLSMEGIAPEAGVLIRPDDTPWRLGATFRLPVEGIARSDSSSETGLRKVSSLNLVVPRSIHLPWELEAGFAIQVGPRPLNPHWPDPREQERNFREERSAARAARRHEHDRELRSIRDPAKMYRRAQELSDEEDRTSREEDRQFDEARDRLFAERKSRFMNWPRERITVLGEVLVTGETANAVSLESFFSQRVERSGERISLSPRLGLEGEPVPEYLQVRTGTYLEPSRFDGRVARQHFTFGFDVRLGEWSAFGLTPGQIWRFSGMTDVAPRYENFGMSFGAWH